MRKLKLWNRIPKKEKFKEEKLCFGFYSTKKEEEARTQWTVLGRNLCELRLRRVKSLIKKKLFHSQQEVEN